MGFTSKYTGEQIDTLLDLVTEGGIMKPQTSAKAVNFRDYDGTILHSYTKEEFLALNELPPLPTQKGLICQEWNWSYEEAKEYVSEYGVLEVGATYITDDGKTRLYIRIAELGRMDVPLYFQQTVANGVTIDWGDGSATETLSGTGNKNTTHHYEDKGDYMISLEVADGCILELGQGSSRGVLGNMSTASEAVYSNMLKKVEIGKGVTSIYNCAFVKCYSLTSIAIPEGVTSIQSYAFEYCNSLLSLVIPSSVTTIDDAALRYCYSLSSVEIPHGVTSIGTSALYGCSSLFSVGLPKSVKSIKTGMFTRCYSLSLVVIPQSITSIPDSIFSDCSSLTSVMMPEEITSIGSSVFSYCMALPSAFIPSNVSDIKMSMFRDCYSLSLVVIPQSITSIGTYAFYNCTGVALYDFRASTSVPSLSATNAFSYIPPDCKIVVPDALYDEWIAATNWSTYASKIVKASEFNA